MLTGPAVFIFNSPLSSGCDYVVQTIRLVSKRVPTFGIALGDIISLKQLLLGKDIWFIKVIQGATIIRPVSLIPGLRFRSNRLLTFAITCIVLRFVLFFRYFGQRKTLWFFEPFHIAELFWIFSGYQTIYDCVDYFPAFSPYAKLGHSKLLQNATLVFANSGALQHKLKETRPSVIQAPLGFAKEVFSSYKKKEMIRSEYTVGYIGSISARLDVHFLNEVIQLLPNTKFVFVGPYEKNVYDRKDTLQKEFSRLLHFSNVEWKKEIPKEMVPKIIDGFSVCLIPYDISNDFNKYSFPMKALEYLYLGKPVLATDIRALRGLPGIYIVHSPKEISDYVRHKIVINKILQMQQQKYALNNSWDRKVAYILSFL